MIEKKKERVSTNDKDNNILCMIIQIMIIMVVIMDNGCDGHDDSEDDGYVMKQ
jgi:hypothetical protein